jgi:F-type H+-transporting ATPase subunit alpha
MAAKGRDIASLLKQEIGDFGSKLVVYDIGNVFEIGDGIARIHGLASAKYNELLQFPHDIMGIAMNLEEDNVASVILGDYAQIKEGDEVRCTGRIAEVTVGQSLIGRVVDPLGRPLDGKGIIKGDNTRPLERVAPSVTKRKSVNTPVQTGIKAIDSLIPIGRGQRELIIGDRSTGKTAIALDTIINQKGGNLICIYVAIGQKTSKVARVVGTLEAYGAMAHTIVIAANAADSVALQYLAPYAGCAMGEEFMEQGKDALVIYDDLTRHAWAYRQLSLLLRRPPGREAYPGDVFYLHSRLLERAAKYSDEFGGGSLTALPIIETQAGDLSAYIPTNVISITDGQMFMETDLFNAGIRPALNVGNSVSRVGSSAQTRAMRKVAGRLRIELAQYRELAAFAQFGTAELDKATRSQLDRVARITEVLKQPLYVPQSMEKQVLILYAAINGHLDDIAIDKIRGFESGFQKYMETAHPEVASAIAREKDISQTTEEALKSAIREFKQTFK